MASVGLVEDALSRHAWAGGPGASVLYDGRAGGRLAVADLGWDELWARGASGLGDGYFPVTATYDSTYARVLISATGMDPWALATVERSIDLVTWATVRGGVSLDCSEGVISLYDYEFTDAVATYYRVRTLAPFGASVMADAVTPALTAIWLKSLTRPFLNRAITVVDWADPNRPGRGADLDIVGRTLPVGQLTPHGSRRWSLEVYTADAAARQGLDYLVASGDALLVHCPASCGVPGGYARLGDTGQRRPAGGQRSTGRVTTLPLVEIAPPAADVGYALSTWASVLAAYATWDDLLAANATWDDLLARVGDPSEVIVA